MSRQVAIVAAVLLALGGASAEAQEKEEKAERSPKAEAKEEARSEREGLRSIRGVTATLRVQLVISRYQGEKKVSSQPYTIVLSTTGSPTSLRVNVSTPMGVETTTSKDGDKTTSTRYQSIGTSIDCRVYWTTPTNPASDTFDVNVNLNDSSLFNPEGDTKIPVSAMAIMSFSANNTLTMRNGQTMLLTTATNKVTGEVIKVEVTFTLLK